MNTQIISIDKSNESDHDRVIVLLNTARLDERKNQAEVAAARLVRLASHIAQNGLNAIEAVELLRQEAEAIEHKAQELH
ncbi:MULTISPECIES: DUF2732 family protein [unclassified Serratia (in: enterobacteria)]|uniref:DUF2732 family protein n=1 Tax=unclassified Serratia (in: enterobacteria) TaxID=2647522 RepID=UPI0018AB7120|nr:MULTISPECIES: DUF2732 family protein [unclassified Serratia (in: enterobacteria)]